MLSETLERASEIVLQTKGKIARLHRIQNYILSFFVVVLLVISVSVGISLQSWFWGLILLGIYGILVSGFLYFRKSKTAKPFRTAHVALSLFLRAENNRCYMRNGVELRPGYLAKWIEISVLHRRDPAEIIKDVTSRNLNQSLVLEKLKAARIKESLKGLSPKYLEENDLEEV